VSQPIFERQKDGGRRADACAKGLFIGVRISD